jgi:hypothetical protein
VRRARVMVKLLVVRLGWPVAGIFSRSDLLTQGIADRMHKSVKIRP